MTASNTAPMAPPSTSEAIERGYNNRAAVPDHPRWLAKYVEASRDAVAALRPELDLRYGPGPKETLDLFIPSSRPRGTVVFIHGGYWRTLDKSDFSFVAPPLVARDFAVAVVNYDLCPQVSITTIVDQCRSASVWLTTNASNRIGAERMVVAGHSAGGHLAAMMLATDWRSHGLDHSPYMAGLSLSGIHELEPLIVTSMNADLRLSPEEAGLMSPARLRPQTGAPLLIACGADETSEFVRQSRLMFDAWPDNRLRGMTGPLYIERRHHFDVVFDHGDPDSALTQGLLNLF